MGEWMGSNPGSVVLAALAVGGALVAIGQWIGAVNADRGKFSEFMREVRDDLRTIRAQITDLFRLVDSPHPVSGASPLHLTDMGKDMAARLDAYEWARKLAPRLRDEVAGKKPFQIDEFCQRYAYRRLSDEMETRVAQFVYESGNVRTHVLSVLHVVLRDELLKLTGQVAE